eukprot:TRINITY_DN27245_c0_g1_i1.p1 TRINITY_DN27245_c0_g1~~TRINITY_DN27245_c0_g1_i1.p1  ORF type:complete len:482 (-),score=69.35 TRINITY_DN27245_c0_g1_i1:71-1516(-)
MLAEGDEAVLPHSPMRSASLSKNFDPSGSVAPSSPWGGSFSASPADHLHSQVASLQGQLAMLSQIALNRPAENHGQNQFMAFTLGEKMGAFGKHGELESTRLTSIATTVEGAIQQLAAIQSDLRVLQAEAKFQATQSAATLERLERQADELTRTSRDITELQQSAEFERRLQATLRDATDKHLELLDSRQSDTRTDLATVQLHQRGHDSELRRIQDEGRDLKQQLAGVKQDSDGTSSRVDALNLNFKLDRESQQSSTARLERQLCEASTAVKSLDDRFAAQLREANQNAQSQLNSVRLELLAAQRQPQGDLLGGLTPFLMQLVLPFVSRDNIASMLLWLRSFRADLFQDGMKRVWCLLLIGDVSLRVAKRKFPSAYQLVHGSIPSLGFSPRTQWCLRMLRLFLEVFVMFQVSYAVQSYLHAQYLRAMEAVESARENVETRLMAVGIFGVATTVGGISLYMFPDYWKNSAKSVQKLKSRLLK